MIEKITQEKANALCVSSLPTRPTAPASAGGAGYSSVEMKNAFDALTLHVIEKYNLLIDAIREVGEGSIASEIPTAIRENHTLKDLFWDVLNGNFASYLAVGDKTLAVELSEIRELLNEIKERI